MSAVAYPAKLLFDVADTKDRTAGKPLEWDRRGFALAIILVASFGLVAKPASGACVRL
jgi:hypothetical protein